jgi:hypothetical protein
MFTLPPETPVTIPVLPTVAIPVLLLLHTPPLITSVMGVVIPVHMADTPVTDGTKVYIFTSAPAEQPAAVYNIVACPAPVPVTTPVVAPTVATAVLLLLHVPPPEPVKVEVAPEQSAVTPEAVGAVPLTVTGVVATQPAPSE